MKILFAFCLATGCAAGPRRTVQALPRGADRRIHDRGRQPPRRIQDRRGGGQDHDLCHDRCL
ncbi:MAG: hypothetical protein MZW92_05510 [Comamonadaceae bacterium]|nr:hypothetical protein [Comamonadaceae bacterium]